MNARWPMLLLAGVLIIGCRTPKKSVSVWPVFGESAGHGGDHAGAVPNRDGSRRDSETRSRIQSAPTNTPESTSNSPSKTDALPVRCDENKEAVHATNQTERVTAAATTVVIKNPPISSTNTGTNTKPVAQAAPQDSERGIIHLPVPGGTNSLDVHAPSWSILEPRSQPIVPLHNQQRPISITELGTPRSAMTTPPAVPRLPVGNSLDTDKTKSPSSVTISLNGQPASTDPQPQPKPLALPDAGDEPPSADVPPAKPIYVEPILDGSADEAQWRDWQLARNRAAEKSRQAERENLTQAVQQFLQQGAK